jgi:putative colanic acid biosynthesis acetyltransferase WcaF
MLPASLSADSPYRRVNTSLWSRVGRAAWSVVWLCLFRPTPRPLHAWRAGLLRLFGARLGRGCHIYAGARIWAPWNLACGDGVAIADGAEVYNPAPVSLGHHAVVSQQAFLCAASHDYGDPAFPMIVAPIRIGAYAWIGSRASVQMGVTIGDGAVLALGAIATGNLDPWAVHGGIPARRLKSRPRLYGANANSAGEAP